MERAGLEGLLAKEIKSLPYAEQVVLSLYYHEKLRLDEIARVLNQEESQVSRSKCQAILRLRSFLETRVPGREGSRGIQ
jgi:DNA-directed RNA polymerase specialized sigma subunit